MKIFIDSADIGEIREAAAMGVIDGVTTNPSLVAKTGRSLEAVMRDICEVVDGPISAEVIATDTDGILAEGRKLAAIHRNIVVKVPLIAAGIKAVQRVRAGGHQDQRHAVLQRAASAAHGEGRRDVHQPVHRPHRRRRRRRARARSSRSSPSIATTASRPRCWRRASAIRCTSCAAPRWARDVATIPHSVILQLLKHPLTDIGLKRFLEDAKKIPG